MGVVLRLLREFEFYAACGSDDINPKLLIETADDIALVLAKIVTQSLDTSTLLQDWLQAIMTGC